MAFFLGVMKCASPNENELSGPLNETVLCCGHVGWESWSVHGWGRGANRM